MGLSALTNAGVLEWNRPFEMDVRPVIADEQAGPLFVQIGKQ